MSRPVVLIHGMGSSFEHNWASVGWVDLLADAGREALAVELPGHGARRERPVDVAADLIVATAQEHGSVDAVGFSAGGYALMVAAARAPQAFGAIALLGVADTGLAERRGDGAGMVAIAEGLISVEEPTDDTMARMLRRLAVSAGNDPARVAEFVLSEQPYAGLSELHAITARTLVVEGSADVSGPAAQISAAVAGSRRVVLDGVDHFAVPANLACIEAVLSFLDG